MCESLELKNAFSTYFTSPGGYTATHPVIQTFWEVVEGFTDEEMRKLLKFVTSCSRPPLLGFKVRLYRVISLSCRNLNAFVPSLHLLFSTLPMFALQNMYTANLHYQ